MCNLRPDSEQIILKGSKKHSNEKFNLSLNTNKHIHRYINTYLRAWEFIESIEQNNFPKILSLTEIFL
jgi:hypothetical protein